MIAAVIIGGTSLTGGRGTVPGVLIGAALLGVINNGIVTFLREYARRTRTAGSPLPTLVFDGLQ